MKRIVAIILTFFSLSSFAAIVKAGKIHSSGKYLILTVIYGGGCKEHSFGIDQLECQTSYPVECEAKLVEKIKDGPDECYEYIKEEVLLKLKDFNISAKEFSRGSLKLYGGKTRDDSEPSQVKIKFPEF